MHKTEQTSGQSVWQHGTSVSTLTEELILALQMGLRPEGWRIPDWLLEAAPKILTQIHPDKIRQAYTVHHDCGKPYCRTVDEEGRAHFPDHAEVSRSVYLNATGDETVANLIGWDMDLHSMSSAEIQSRCDLTWSASDAFTLLLVALAELHSNARMFGGDLGIESNSFKIKWKHLDRRGKQILRSH